MTLSTNNLRISIIPILTNNYSYVIHHAKSKVCAVVDCAEPQKVWDHVTGDMGLKIGHVLTTHKHWDHAGGNSKMKQLDPDMIVVGSSGEEVEGVTHQVSDGDKLLICEGNVEIQVFKSPCHTRGHVLYYIPDEAIFVGDTFFVAGCGRFFEGDAHQMWRNVQLMKSLPQHVKMYCGHEYTLNNIAFALTVDPKNTHLQEKREWAKKQRDANLPTIPSTIAEEFQYNPFFRCDSKEIMSHFQSDDPVDVMKQMRHQKDEF